MWTCVTSIIHLSFMCAWGGVKPIFLTDELCLGIIMWRKSSHPSPVRILQWRWQTYWKWNFYSASITTFTYHPVFAGSSMWNKFQVWLPGVSVLLIFRTKKKCLPAILADFDDCQLWYYKSLPPSPNRHPITPLNRIKCYISTLRLLSYHIVLSLEWQGLCVCACVCVRTRGCVGAHLFEARRRVSPH